MSFKIFQSIKNFIYEGVQTLGQKTSQISQEIKEDSMHLLQTYRDLKNIEDGKRFNHKNTDVSGNVGKWDIPFLSSTEFQSKNPTLNAAYKSINNSTGMLAATTNAVSNLVGNVLFDLPAAIEETSVKHGGPNFSELYIAAQSSSPGMPVDDVIALGFKGLAEIAKEARAFHIVKKIVPNHFISTLSEKIGNGHAYKKHVLDLKEFPQITQHSEFIKLIEETIKKPDAVKVLKRGRTAYWNEKHQAVVIYDPNRSDLGTFFKPEKGKFYFLNKLK